MDPATGDQEFQQSEFEIFKKDAAGNPIWVETAIGLDQTRKRLIALSGNSTGDYLVFNPRTNTFVDVKQRTKSA
jgi:hypothetical protein